MPAPFRPKLHNEVYSFIEPAKFRASLSGKVTVITGAVGTLGKATAECFAIAGAKLVLVYHKTKPDEDFEARCKNLGAQTVLFVQGDVSDLKSCKEVIAKAEEEVGYIDILVNNAGMESLGSIQSRRFEDIAKDIDVNLLGPLYLTKLVMPGWLLNGEGCVINIASRAGTIDTPFNTTYSATKAALIRLTSCWQKELELSGYGDIQMYALHPGALLSGMVSSDRVRATLTDHPDIIEMVLEQISHFKDSPYLSGMTAVALATGLAKRALNGRYFDVQHDLEDVVSQSRIIQEDTELYSLHTKFLAGLPNNGGTEHEQPGPRFDFPGFDHEGDVEAHASSS